MSSEGTKTENLDKLMTEVIPNLRRYLEERNVTISDSGKFRCINPRHKDDNPSCSFVPGSEETIFNCFSCGAKGNIFHAANLLESKPMSGRGWVHDNLLYLADKYGIAHSEVEMSDEELVLRRTYRAYEDASDIISDSSMQPVTYLQKRSWSPTVCRELGIGSVKSYDDFLSRMDSRGYDRAFCDDIDLNSQLFNERMLIFAIRDEIGRTVGFSSRDMDHNKDSRRPKFINTSAKCQLYSKGAILYGIDIGQKFQPPLYIFEGYPDYVTAYKHGIKNVCAIGGTALTREHIALLKKLGIYNIVLALDADNAGRERTDKLLDEYFGGDETLNVSVQLLNDGDPDEFISANGPEAFIALPTLTPFQWRLSRFLYSDKPEYICDKMIPIILGTSNLIYRECMCKELAEKTGVDYKIIKKQIERETNKEEAQKDSAVQTKIRQLVNDLKYHKGDPATLLESTAEELRQLNPEVSDDRNSVKEVIASIDMVRESFLNRVPGLQGWRTGYEIFDEAISGIPKTDTMITFAGDSNVGKTGFMFELALRLAKYNPKIMVLFMTIDDSRQQALARLVALEAGLRINQVSHPRQNIGKDLVAAKKFEEGWKTIRALVQDGRFSIKDNLHGNTLDFAENWIRWAKDNNKDREICFFLDNFHKLGDEPGADERIRFKHASNRIHGMKNKLGFTAICTMELRKMLSGSGITRPTLQDISESKQMEYDNNLIGMVYNDVHARRHEAKIFWDDSSGPDSIKKPVFELDIQKNKISEYKDTLYWKFSPEHSKFDEVSGEEVDEWQKEYRAAMKSIHDKRNPEPGPNPYKFIQRE